MSCAQHHPRSYPRFSFLIPLLFKGNCNEPTAALMVDIILNIDNLGFVRGHGSLIVKRGTLDLPSWVYYPSEIYSSIWRDISIGFSKHCLEWNNNGTLILSSIIESFAYNICVFQDHDFRLFQESASVRILARAFAPDNSQVPASPEAFPRCLCPGPDQKHQPHKKPCFHNW